ncbi:hypothetical protein [Laspinema palackyanum]|nr:hypothetical protein [Laspinema sp. D2c]
MVSAHPVQLSEFEPSAIVDRFSPQLSKWVAIASYLAGVLLHPLFLV